MSKNTLKLQLRKLSGLFIWILPFVLLILLFFYKMIQVNELKVISHFLIIAVSIIYFFIVLIEIYSLIKSCLTLRALHLKQNVRFAKGKISIVIFIAIILAIFSGILMWYNPLNLKNYNPDFGGLVGGTISGIATLLVIRFTVTIDEKKTIAKARTSAGILNEILNSVYYQIERIGDKENSKIYYPPNWLEYYSDVTNIAKYDYLSQISKELNYIDRLNEYIEAGEKEKVKGLLNMRHYYIFNSTQDFNIHEIQFNLAMINSGLKEKQPWDTEKENLDLIKGIQKNFYSVVENWIYNRLLIKGSSELSDIDDELVQWLKRNEHLKKVYDKRVIRRAIVGICSEIDKTSIRISFCWNELSLK